MYIFLFIFVKECYNLGSPLVAQRKTKRKRKICLQMKEMWIQSLDQEDLREEEIATHSNSLVWAIPWTEEHGGLHFSSVQFSHSVMSNSLQPHGLQHARLPCPSPTPRVYPNSCPLSWWCHPTISSSVVPFSSHLQSKCGWLEKGMANHFSILALRTPWTVWKGLHFMGLQKGSGRTQWLNSNHNFKCAFSNHPI